MQPYSTFVVSPTLPNSLQPLKELAYNYWWCWQHSAISVFRKIDPALWDASKHNPVDILSKVSYKRLLELSTDAEYLAELGSVHRLFREYIEGKGWYATLENAPTSYVAYFCAEFGIHESFSCYSGGLGVLAGDHLKSASDLGIPLIAIGLLYQEGYFRQYLTQNGWQNENYEEVDFHQLPLTLVTNGGGEPVTVCVQLKDEECFAQIWRTNVGRVPLYLLDTNITLNATTELRTVTNRLYGGGVEDRVRQELVLGIGGCRALQALGIEPAAFHINEGHAAFSLLERTKQFMNRYSLTFEEAYQCTRATTIFTTHTPVPAGNEVFSHDLIRPYLEDYANHLTLTYSELSLLGAANADAVEDGFSMTILGLRSSMYRNGVSQLHGYVTREMWKDVWPEFSVEEIPISGITNGVHTATWVSNELSELFDTYLGTGWRMNPHSPDSWKAVKDIPNEALWEVHCTRKRRLVKGAREHILSKHGSSLTQEQVSNINDCLDPEILTIGFARRFASYKRATLLMHDMERLAAIVRDADRPVQVILAGKAHPKDNHGKELIESAYQLIAQYDLGHRMVFLEDYDMDVAKLMVRGCDIWLNTPRRPHEASGTSGMKAAVNGVLHCSILDGWWAEAYDGENGFAIGRGEEFEPQEQDAADALTLYDQLEHAIIPAFYANGKGNMSVRWMTLMKRSISELGWRFSALRMVQDYATDTYVPAMLRYRQLNSDSGTLARDYVQFAKKLASDWENVAVLDIDSSGDEDAHVGRNIHIRAKIALGTFKPEDVIVQIVQGGINAAGDIRQVTYHRMDAIGDLENVTMFGGGFTCERSGTHGFTVRVIPIHPLLHHLADGARITVPVKKI